MRTILEDLYYGNIIPNEQQMTPGSELKRAVDRVTRYESQLMEQLKETEQEILTKLIRSQHETTVSQQPRISFWVSDWVSG